MEGTQGVMLGKGESFEGRLSRRWRLKGNGDLLLLWLMSQVQDRKISGGEKKEGTAWNQISETYGSKNESPFAWNIP